MKNYILMLTMLCASTAAFGTVTEAESSSSNPKQTKDMSVQTDTVCPLKSVRNFCSDTWNVFSSKASKIGSAIQKGACKVGSVVQKESSKFGSFVRKNVPTKNTVLKGLLNTTMLLSGLICVSTYHKNTFIAAGATLIWSGLLRYVA